MEDQFFIWGDRDGAETHTKEFWYYQCEVTKAFGPFKIGDKLKTVCMDYDDSNIHVYDENDDLIFEGKLVLSIELE